MKVGILTFHHGHNFGGFMQTYSLFSYVKHQGCDVWVINYVNPRHFLKKTAMTFFNPNIAKMYVNIHKARYFHRAHRRYRKTPFTFKASAISKEAFDVVILGSDEIWNYQNPMFGFDPTYFGCGFEAKKVIAYAASLGALNHTAEPPSVVSSALRRLSYISVRDVNTQTAVRQLTGIDPDIHADPAFLYDFDEPAAKIDLKGYILIYTADLCAAMIDEIKRFAQKQKKKLVALAYPKSWCDKNIYSEEIWQWRSLFVNADMIITTMFHGTVFAIKNQKPFVFLMNDYRRFKVDYLFDYLGLCERIYDQNDSLDDIFNQPIDYDFVNKQLNTHIDKSKGYLQNAING